MTRLKHLAVPVVEKLQPEDELPRIDLEHIEGFTGELLGEPDELVGTVGDRVRFRPGDVLVSKLRPYLGKSFHATFDGAASSELIVLRPLPGVSSRWLSYTVLSQPFTAHAVATSSGVKMPRTSSEHLVQYPLDLPGADTQRRVADYLDRETQRIDSIISKNERMLSLLEERFANLAAGLLLKRLPTYDPVAVITPPASGLPRVKHLISDHFAGKTPKEGLHWVEHDDAVAVPWLGVGDFEHGVGARSANRFLSREGLRSLGLRTMPPGTVLFAMYGATAGKVAPLEIEATWNQAVLGLLPDPRRVRSEYLVEWLKLAGPAARVLSRSNTQDNFNAEQILNLPVPLPAPDEQAEVVAQLREERRVLDSTARLLPRQNELLMERRQALITAAVTGKLDIGEAA